MEAGRDPGARGRDADARARPQGPPKRKGPIAPRGEARRRDGRPRSRITACSSRPARRQRPRVLPGSAGARRRETLDRFEIGFAPAARQGAFSALTGKGIAADEIARGRHRHESLMTAARPMTRSATGSCSDPRRAHIFLGRCIGFGGARDGPERAGEIPELPRDPAVRTRAARSNISARRARRRGKGQPLVVVLKATWMCIAWCKPEFEAARRAAGDPRSRQGSSCALMWRIAETSAIIAPEDGDKSGPRRRLRLGRSLGAASLPWEPGKVCVC